MNINRIGATGKKKTHLNQWFSDFVCLRIVWRAAATSFFSILIWVLPLSFSLQKSLVEVQAFVYLISSQTMLMMLAVDHTVRALTDLDFQFNS